MGFDLITRAALTIDGESRCVWSKHTLRCHIKQDLANACAKLTIQVNADPFLDTVPPSERAGCKDMSEYKCCEQELTPLSTASSCTEFFENTADSRFPYTCRLETRVLSTPEYCTSVEAGAQASESFTLDSTDFSCEHTVELSTESLCAENSSELVRTSEQSSGIDSNLNPSATFFVPEHSALVDDSACPIDNLNTGTQTLIESPLENAVTTGESDPPSSIHVVKSLFEPLNFDDDVTLLKTKFDPGGNSSKLDAMEINEESGLPEHVHTLFTQTFEQSDFPVEAADGLKQLLFDHRDTFASSCSDLGFCEILKHDIDTGDARPICQSPRKPLLVARDAEDEILNNMLETGVIEPSNSSWASPVCLVRKKDGTFRFCIDYCRVNAVSKKDEYPIPDIQDVLDNLRGAKYFATFDLLSEYWQLGFTERAKERSAFCTRRGLFQFTRMPFGLSGAPSSFSTLMSIVLRDLLWEICLCYLDDIIIYGHTPQELLDRMRTVLDRLRSVGLKVKPSKCVLFKTEIQYLGHLVSATGINPMQDKVDALRDFPIPKCTKDVRAFVGLVSYYRKFVKGFTTIAKALTPLTSKQIRFEWSPEA